MNRFQLAKGLTFEMLEKVYLKKDYKFFRGYLNLNVGGIRMKTDTNQFDDLIFVAYMDKDGGKHVLVFPATTDPGKYWLDKPMNKDGCFCLLPGQYPKSHTIGYHHGYAALVQVNPVKGIRTKTGKLDNDKDGDVDENDGKESEGVFGINIHRSNPFLNEYYVDRYSAGCQVFMNFAEYNTFMNLCLTASKVQGDIFTYTLLESSDFEDCLELFDKGKEITSEIEE